MTNILITGGTGSLGSALARKWYREGHRITIISRDPAKQNILASELPGATFILADICDYRTVYRACRGQDILVHAAALKDVGTGEYHPAEFVRVNVNGTQTVADAWNAAYSVYDHSRKALFISTDKAANPINSYGASKKLGEAIFRRYDYSVLRYGNVVTSTGAFVQKWQEAIARGEPVVLRTPEPTRFFLTMDMAVGLVEDALQRMDRVGNGIFIPNGLKAFSIWDVARALQVKFLSKPLLPYEKRHETLVAEGEGYEPVSDKLSRIVPYWPDDDDFSFLAPYRTNTAPQMTGQEVLEVLGWQK